MMIEKDNKTLHAGFFLTILLASAVFFKTNFFKKNLSETLYYHY